MKIDVKGPIINDSEQWIYDWFGISAVSPSKINASLEKAIAENKDEIVISINSGGGSVFSASEIYTSLKSFGGKVKVEIVGMAASAASVIAMAGSRIEMSPTAQLMIHNSSTSAWGDYRDMDRTSDFLQNVNRSIMNAYSAKTGKTESNLKPMMDAETWMTAQQALENGFIDAIMFENEQGAAASTDSPHLVNGVLPQEVIDKVRNELLKDRSIATFNNVPAPQTVPTKTQNKGAEKVMNLETLQNEHPELFKEVKNLGFTEGVKAENERMQAIDDMALPGNESMVQAAKYKEPVTAEQLAVKMIKAQKEAGQNHLKNAQMDAQPLAKITPSAAPETDNVSDEDKAVSALVNLWGGKSK